MKGKFLLPLVLLGGLTLTGCGQPKSNPSPKVTYGVAIGNKTELIETWHVGDAQRNLDITLTPAGNPTAEIAAGNLVVESSASTVVAVTGLGLTALSAGTATVTVTYHGVTDSVDFTILAKESAKDKYGVAHEGTAEDPFTNEDALVVAKSDKYNSEIYYVKGEVDAFYALPGAGSENTTSWWLKPAQPNGERFEIYKCKKADGSALTDDDVWVGGITTAFGPFTKYNSQYETSYATFVKCEGEKPEVHEYEVTVAEALAVLETLEPEQTTIDTYIVTGVITEITDPYTDQYKNMTFNLGDTKTSTDVLSCYRCKPAEADAAKFLVGATVKVTGKLTVHKHSDGSTSPQMASGCTGELVSEAPVEELTDISVGDELIAVLKDKTRQLTVTPVPATAVIDSVAYQSGNTAILTVSNSGLITGVAAGETTVTVTATSGTIEKSQVITVKVIASINYGTAEEPLTPDEARFLTRNFVTGAKSEEELTVRGKVSSVEADSYGHKVFWLESEDGTVKKCFECYQCDPATGVDVSKLTVGAVTLVKGYSKQYQQTSEITSYKDSDNNYVYPQILEIVPSEQPEEQPIVVTVAEARALIAALPVPTQSGNQNVEVNDGHLYEITGIVTKLGDWSDSFGNGDMFIADEAGDQTNTLQLYRVNRPSVYFAAEVDTTVVKVTAKLIGYFRDKVLKAYETPQNPNVEVVSGGKDLTLTGIDLGDNFELEAGESKQLTATLAPKGATAELTWSVVAGVEADEGKVEVTQAGLVTVAEGVEVGHTFTIKATSGLIEGSVVLTIKGAEQLGGTDFLDRAFTGVADGATSYTDWSDKAATDGSPALYAGNSAGSNNSIQIRSKNSNSGIVSTKSGGKISKVTVVWESSTTAGNKLDVYGSNTAFTSPTQLYNISGDTIVKLGTIEKGASTELTITGDYTFIGLRSYSGALYITSITIVWVA